MDERRSFPRSSLGLRLTVAFVLVATVAMTAFAGLVLWSARGEVDELVQRERRIALRNTARGLADAYREAGTWGSADLGPARVLALQAGALMTIRDVGGRLVLAPDDLDPRGDVETPGFGPATTAAVIVAGEPVGMVSLRFPSEGLPPAVAELRRALTRSTLLGLAIGTAVAVIVGVLVAHAITGPLRRLTASVRRLGRGDLAARTNVSAPGELGELAAEVDRLADSLEREDALRRALSADVAHELRTPLAVLAAQTEALLDGVVEPTPDQLESQWEEVSRLARAIDDVEALASAEAVSLHLEREPVDIASVVRREAELLTPLFEEAELELRTQVEQRIVIDCDPVRIGQIVRNLLDNARKFTPAGGVVTLAATTRGGKACISVRDTGYGIPAAELPHVFERFWRGADRPERGSGVGLAVVEELARAHGGTVRAVSHEGEGSTFVVELPLSTSTPALASAVP